MPTIVNVCHCPNCDGSLFTIFDEPDGEGWETKFKCHECGWILKPTEVEEKEEDIGYPE